MDVDALRTQQEAFLAVITAADEAELDAVVAPCAPWVVRDLVLHLASVHRWAADAVVAAPGSSLPARTDPHEPRGRDALLAEYAAAAALLRERLSTRAPDAPCIGMVGPGDAAFWARRQSAETAVHRWDLAAARGGDDPSATGSVGAGSVGSDAVGADAVAVWADVVAEVVEVMHPRQVHLGRVAPLPVAVGLVATDADRRWTLGAGPETVVVSGPAALLARLLWRRADVDHPALVVTGDADALRAALATAITP